MPPAKTPAAATTLTLQRAGLPARLPSVLQRARTAALPAAPVLRCDHGSRQLSLPFFAPLAPRGR